MPFLRWTESFPPWPGPELPPRRLEHDGLIDPGRLPSTRSSTLRSRDASLRSRLGLRTSASHPFARRGVIPPCRGKNLRDVLPRAFSVCLSAPLDGVRKMLLADFCNRLTTRAPVDRLIPERGACASPTAATRRAETRERLRRQPVFRRPGPRWSALDGAVPSFGIFDHSRSLPVAERWGVERRADTQWWLPPRRGVVDRVPGWRSTSDTLCRTPRASGSCRPDSPRGTEDRFSRPLVKGCGLFDPERLPSTGCSQRVALAHDGFWWEPATGVSALPPRTRLPARFRRPDALARSG